MLRPTPRTARLPSGRQAPRAATLPPAAAAPPPSAQASAAATATTAAAAASGCSNSVTTSMHKYERLLQWATADSIPPAVAVVDDPYGGRCLRATQAVAPGGVLLSVPMTRVFASKVPDQLQLHWSADQAVELLRLKHLTQQQQQQQQQDHSHDTTTTTTTSSSREGVISSSGGECKQEADWSPWLDVLPQAVATPLEFDDATTQLLGLASTVQDVVELQEVLGACYGEVEEQLAGWGAGWEDFLWVVQVLHSRCFFEPTLAQHLCVPGVDMANHSATPSAAVRIQHNPGMVQGLAALEEVAPVEALAALAAPASYFQLVAGNEGLQEGQEVCISYGPWPAEVFTSLFGFVPTPNPHDHLVLYTNLADMGQHVCQLLLEQLQHLNSSKGCANVATISSSSSSGSGLEHPASATQQQPQQEHGYRQVLQEVLTLPDWEQQLQEQLGAAAAADGGGSTTAAPQQQQYIRLVATAEGLDARLGAAYQAVMAAVAAVLQRHLVEAAGAVPAAAAGSQAAAAAAAAAGGGSTGHGPAPLAPSADKEATQWLQQQLAAIPLNSLVTRRLRDLQQHVQPLPADADLVAAAGWEVPRQHLQLVQQYRQQKWDTAQRVLQRMAAQSAAAGKA